MSYGNFNYNIDSQGLQEGAAARNFHEPPNSLMAVKTLFLPCIPLFRGYISR
jgi:hypothetical protein